MSALQNPVVILAILTWLAAPAGSLGEAAKKEAIRRQMMPKSKATLTNLGMPAEIILPSMMPPPTSAATTASDEPPVAGAPPQTAAAATPPAAATGKQDEAWWRSRINTARSMLDRDQLMAVGLQSRINALQAEVVNEDNPVKNNKLRAELQKMLDELDRTNKQIAADQAAIRTIQEEARRADVPAGWIR